MKSRAAVVAIVVAALALSGCHGISPKVVANYPTTAPVSQQVSGSGADQTDKPEPTSTSDGPDSSLSVDFSSSKHGFKAKFPTQPQEDSQVASEAGQSATITLFSTESLKNAYTVSTFSAVCSPEGDDIATRLKASATGSLNGIAKYAGDPSPKISSQKSISLSGKPALETIYSVQKSGQPLPVSSVVVIDGTRFYTLIMLNSTPQEWADFSSNFVITAHPAAAAACAPYVAS